MLTSSTIDIIKATAPILQEHGETLTRHFYKRMFEYNPEVLPFFNPAHQAEGKQQRALASAVAAYATYIDRLDVLADAVELIAQKHASLMVKSEHYPIVGSNLLASIREVLGEAATDDIIQAWAQAYGALADILVAREQKIYDENAQKPGGWEGFKPFQVIKKECESECITSFYLAPQDASPLPSFKPGQYITVRVGTEDGSTTMRNYSLSHHPTGEWLRISVKKEPAPQSQTPAGYVSHLLHDTINQGDTVQIAPPCGEFTLDPTQTPPRPIVFLAGGVGITPIHTMLSSILAAHPDHPVTLVHAVTTENHQAFQAIHDQFAKNHQNLNVLYRYSEQHNPSSPYGSSGLVTPEYLSTIISDKNADYYFCGPQPFMTSVYKTLQDWNIPKTQIHFEFFGPFQDLTS